MDIFDAIRQDRPYTAYAFPATALSFNNIYGGNPAVTTSGTNITVGGATNTKIVSGLTSPINVGTDKLKIPFPLLAPTFEQRSFSLEIWFRGFNPTGEVSLLSHNNAYDGLTYDGNYIYFRIKFGTAATAQIAYLLPVWEEIYHVVGTYDGLKMVLYVNGVAVGTYTFTPAQDADVFATPTDAFLYSGQSTTTQKVIIDAPAIYFYPLSSIKVTNHYIAGQASLKEIDNVTKRTGLYWPLADDQRNIVMSRQINFNTGTPTKVVVGASVKPVLDATFTSVAGSWIVSVPINLTEDTSIGGVKVEWTGTGTFTVEGSINNGGAWTTLTNGQMLASTLSLDTTGLNFDIRVTFAGGVLNDPAELTSLYVVVYGDYVVSAATSTPRVVTLSGAAVTSTVDEQIIQEPDRKGLLLYGGTGVISADASGDIKNVATLEMWVKFNTLSGTLYNDGTNSLSIAAGVWSGSANLKYVNSVLTATASMPQVLGQWYHLVFTFTGHNSPITIGALQMQVGHIATYPTVLSQSDITDLYNTYFKVPEAIIDDAAYSATLAEDVGAYNIYAYDWTVSTG